MQIQVPNVPIAFFDLDETIINEDANSLWLKWRVPRSVLSLPELCIGLYNRHYYKRGRLTERKMFLYFQARTMGLSGDAYRRMARRFFHEKGRHHVYAGALEMIDAHRDRGIHTVIITGQDNFITEPFYDRLGVDGFISNRRIERGRRLGGFHTPNCYGAGKITLAGDYARTRGCALRECSFFTDSISDLPLMREVGHPVAVNPDPELRSIAENAKWRICSFDTVVSLN